FATFTSTSFTTTVRVVDRVHGNATDRRTDTTPAHGTGFADLTQAVFFVSDFAYGCTAVDVNAADFARAQAHLGISTFAGHQDSRCAGGAGHLRTLARKHFDAVDGGTDRYIADGQRVARADGGIQARQQGSAHFQAAGSDDVATLAVRVAQQCDVRGTVGVVFKTLDLGRNTVLVATEVDDTVVLLVAAAAMANGDVTVVVAARTTLFLFEQSCERLALVQIRADDLDHATATGRSRLDFYECHLLHLRKVEFLTVFERDICLALVTAATHET